MNPFGKEQLAEKSFTHELFSGLRNNVPSSRFSLTDLATATNVDIDDSGRPLRRLGFGNAVQSGSWHSLSPPGPRCFGVTGTNLVEVMPNYSTKVLATVTPNAPVEYFYSAARIYWSNGYEKGCIEGAVNRSWGLDVPPSISGTVTAGTLMIGKTDLVTTRYQFVMTYLRNDGQESGAGTANYLDVPNNGGIAFSNLPVSSDSTVDKKAIYISEPNGETMYRAIVLNNAQTSATYRNRGRMTLPLATQFLEPPPPGTIISLQGGSMLVAVGNKLYYSEPFAFELFDRRKNKLFASPITIVCSFDNGSHVATEDLHVWLAGDTPDKWEWNARASYGAIPRTLDFIDLDAALFGKTENVNPVGLWATKEGIVQATAEGALINLTRARFMYPIQETGATVVRGARGMHQYIVTLKGAETPAPSFS